VSNTNALRKRVTRGDRPLYVQPVEGTKKWEVVRWDGIKWKEKFTNEQEAIDEAVRSQMCPRKNDDLDRKLRDAYQIASGGIPSWEMESA
jgi:hypothetical protein